MDPPSDEAKITKAECLELRTKLAMDQLPQACMLLLKKRPSLTRRDSRVGKTWGKNEHGNTKVYAENVPGGTHAGAGESVSEMFLNSLPEKAQIKARASLNRMKSRGAQVRGPTDEKEVAKEYKKELRRRASRPLADMKE